MPPFFVCLFVWVQIKNFSLIWRRHHYRCRAANFDLYSALMAIEHWAWGFFGVSHLWQGAFIYNGRLRGHVTLAPVAERLAVELSPSLLRLCYVDLNTKPSACETNALTDCATTVVLYFEFYSLCLGWNLIAKKNWNMNYPHSIFSLHWNLNLKFWLYNLGEMWSSNNYPCRKLYVDFFIPSVLKVHSICLVLTERNN